MIQSAEGVFVRGSAGDVAALLVAVAISLAVLAVAFRRPSDRRVQRWAGARSLVLTGESRNLVLRYLTRTRRLRSLGFLLGSAATFLPGNLYNFVSHDSQLGRTLLSLAHYVSGWAPAAVGYLLGALIAEFSLVRPGGGRPPRAALIPRELMQYVNPRARRSMWAIAGLLVLLAPWPALLPLRPRLTPLMLSLLTSGIAPQASVPPGPTVHQYVLLAGLGVGVLLLVEIAQRAIVRRPQSNVDPSVVEADDALRASSVAACTGVGLGTLMWVLAVVVSDLAGQVDVPGVSWVLGIGGFLLSLAALRVWLVFGTSYAWVVRRRPQALPAP